MIVSAARNTHAHQILVIVDRLDNRREENDELEIVFRGFARIKQILGFGSDRPVIVLARAVDAIEGLFVKQANQTVAGSEKLHLLHGDEIVVDRLVDLGIYRSKLVLARRDLVMLGLCGNAERPQLVIEIFHEGGNRGTNGAEIMLLEFLAFARRIAKEGTARNYEIFALSVVVLLDKEVLLLIADGRNNLLGGFAEKREHALRLAIESGNGAQQRGLLVEGLAGIGAESGGNAQDLVFDERGARGIPRRITAGLERGAQTAIREA